MIKLSPFALGLSLLTIVACGKNANQLQQFQPVIEEQQELEGEYHAILRPLNTHLSGHIPSGKAEIKVKGNEVRILTYLDDATNVYHIQSIHNGNRCPELAHDQNADGLIDIQEALNVSGKVLIPLQRDLTNPANEPQSFPHGSSYTYQQRSPLDVLQSNAYAAGAESSPWWERLAPDQPFNLAGKVILILGTVKSERLPNDLKSIADWEAHLSVPVACGRLERVDK
jgi:hypothetical protein